MRKLFTAVVCMVLISLSCKDNEIDQCKESAENMEPFLEYPEGYLIKKIDTELSVDANWDKPQWAGIDTIKIDKVLWNEPKFIPKTYAKIMYDDENLYVIFKVEDRYVRCLQSEINGSVWEDACVELFFAPDSTRPFEYFNLEINCGGTPLLFFSVIPREFTILPSKEISKIEIASSLPDFVYPEIKVDTTWCVEYRLPFDILEKYSELSRPAPGVVWKANLYKIATETSNKHYMAWKTIDSPKPDFHRPEFFGNIVFE